MFSSVTVLLLTLFVLILAVSAFQEIRFSMYLFLLFIFLKKDSDKPLFRVLLIPKILFNDLILLARFCFLSKNR